MVVGLSNTASTNNNTTFKSGVVTKSKNATCSSNKQVGNDRYEKYVKDFNDIPKKANRFFWTAQVLGTAIGALAGLFAMSKGKLLASPKEATIIGAAAGWFLSFCMGLGKKESVVEKQNELTQKYMEDIGSQLS